MQNDKEDFSFLKSILNGLGKLLKKTYSYSDDTYSDWKYVYFFFYQRVLLFNFHVPWPCHYTSYVTSPSNIKFGKRTSPGSAPFQYIQGENGIIIGDNVQFAPGVQLISANHNFEDFDIPEYSPPLKIGSNVWLGANVVVLPGVEIGNNVVIGAGSIVTKSIPSDSIAVGNPCKVIKNKPPYKA